MISVTSTQIDLATCSGIKLCKDIDPQGKRTIGVITKSDLCVEQHMRKKLASVFKNQEDIRLMHGYRAVINRTKD